MRMNGSFDEDIQGPYLQRREPMKVRGSWVLWLGLAIAGVGAGESNARTQLEKIYPEQSPARLPLKQIPAEVRDTVRQVLEKPTLSSQGPAETFGGDPALYLWLLDHPDRALLAWRRLGAPCTQHTNLGGGHLGRINE